MADANRAVPLGTSVGQGIALVLLANLLFSFVDTSTKWLLAAGLAIIPLAFMRYAVHFAITLIERTISGRQIQTLPRPLVLLVLARSFCIVSATVVNFVAIGHLSLTISSALLYLAPIFICVFARLILGEPIYRYHWIAIALGLSGALVILWPFGEPINWYAMLMLYPATAFALYQVLTRKLAHHVRTGTMQLYTGALGTLVLLPFVFVTWTTPQTNLEWLLFCAIGAVAWAGHEALTRAHGFAKASTLAPFGYSFIVYLTIASFFVFSDVPGTSVFVGAALIFAGGMYAWVRGSV